MSAPLWRSGERLFVIPKCAPLSSAPEHSQEGMIYIVVERQVTDETARWLNTIGWYAEGHEWSFRLD